jgi:hypothetical protein
VVGHQHRGEESGSGWPGAGGRESGIWGRSVKGGSGSIEGGGSIKGGSTEGGGGVEGGDTEVGSGVKGGDGGAEVGGSVEGGGAAVGQPDHTKPKFTTIRVSRWWGYSPYTRYFFDIG